MQSFIIRRLWQAIPILLGVSVLAFLMVQLMPGDITDLMIPPGAPQELADELAALYGLDQPMIVQYWLWLKNVMVGNFGVSLVSGRPVAGELLAALANTLQITVVAAVVGFALGILFGCLAALKRGGVLDRVFSFVAILGVSVPHYWLALVMVTIFSVELNWLPAQGMARGGVIPLTWDQWRHMILPVMTLSLIPMGMVARIVKASVIEVRSQDFIGALEAKGMTSRSIWRHVAKNAAPTVLALMGLQFGYLIGGSILVETVFNWPGTGKLLNLAIFSRDMPVIQATILLLAVIFVFVNLIVDFLQAILDPRMRRS